MPWASLGLAGSRRAGVRYPLTDTRRTGKLDDAGPSHEILQDSISPILGGHFLAVFAGLMALPKT